MGSVPAGANITITGATNGAQVLTLKGGTGEQLRLDRLGRQLQLPP